MIDHHIMRLHVAMHNTLAVAEIQRLQELVDIIADVEVGEARVQRSEVRIVDVLEDQTRRFALVVAHHIQQGYHIGTTREVLKDLDLALDLLFLDRLEDLDDALLIVDDIDTLEHLGILSSTYRAAVSIHNTFTIGESSRSESKRGSPETYGLPILRTTS